MALRKFVVFGVFTVMILLTSISVASEKAQLRAQDRVEIEQLMWEYIKALDSGDAEAYAMVFAPNGQFGKGDTAIKGRDALKKMMLDAKQQMSTENTDDKVRPRMYHVVTNPHIEFIDNDHARFYAYWMGVMQTGGEIVGAGREVNDLVKINGRWFISIRDVSPED